MVTLKPYVWILAMGKGALRGRVQKPLINTGFSPVQGNACPNNCF